MTRTQRGSTLAEFGPALCILFMCLFFPLLDMVILGLQYCACAQLVSLQAQKAAQVTKAETVGSIGNLASAWLKTGLGNFVRLEQPPISEVFYQKIDAREENVTVKTSFVVPPFLLIPICPGVPGLGAPATFSISTQRLMEDPDHQ